MKKIIENVPSANILMNSLRSMGYTFEASIADIIDNSISADAKIISIDFPPSKDRVYITILDNGIGMTHSELSEAMRFGSQHKDNVRGLSDLGRFGLGLKSASLSQAKILTVVSKKNNITTAMRWDLNHIEKVNSWQLIEVDINEIDCEEQISKLKSFDSGTLVIWEDFDIMNKATGGFLFDEITNKMVIADAHLSLVFHRFLNGEVGPKINISINGRQLVGRQPFLESHKKTEFRPANKLQIKNSNGEMTPIYVQPFVLPFQKELSKKDIELLGGIDSLRESQGFYIYRSNRLLIWGTWFRMRFSHEMAKYARIKVDIPNSLDDIWEIDVKKQTATLPTLIKNNLKKIVETSSETSKKKNTLRSRVSSINTEFNVWSRFDNREGNYTYKVNQESLIMKKLEQEVNQADYQKFLSVLSIIEQSLPYQAIYTDVSVNKVTENDDEEEIQTIINDAISLINYYKKITTKPFKDFILHFVNNEPFNNKKIKEAILEEFNIND